MRQAQRVTKFVDRGLRFQCDQMGIGETVLQPQVKRLLKDRRATLTGHLGDYLHRLENHVCPALQRRMTKSQAHPGSRWYCRQVSSRISE